MPTIMHADVFGDSTNNALLYASSSGGFAPAIGDLLLVCLFVSSAAPTPGSMSADDRGLNETQFVFVGQAATGGGGDNAYLFVADRPCTTTTTRQLAVNMGDDATGTGGVVTVIRVAGMALFGLDAIRQYAHSDNNTAGQTPCNFAAFSVAPRTGSPVIAFAHGHVDLTATPSYTPHPEYTEGAEGGCSTPSMGSTYMFQNAFNGVFPKWRVDDGSAFADMAVELNASGIPAGFSPQARGARCCPPIQQRMAA